MYPFALKNSLITAFLNHIKTNATNLYLTIGKTTSWNAYDAPPVMSDLSVSFDIESKNEVVALFKVNPDNCFRSIKTVHWTEGMSVEKYDSNKSYIDYVYPYYVIVDNTHIFLCLDIALNPTALSFQKPINIGSGSFDTPDGITWLKIYTIPSNHVDKITSYTPLTNDGIIQDTSIQSYGITSLNTQQIEGLDTYLNPIIELYNGGTNAVFSVRTNSNIKDIISNISVIASGTNYTHKTYGILKESGLNGSGAILSPIIENGVITNVQIHNNGAFYDSAICMVIGDGTGAKIDLTVSSGVISGVHIISGGSNYTLNNTKLIVVSGDSARYLTPSLIPYNGIAGNIYDILQAHTVLVYIKLPNLNLEYLPTVSELMYRQVGLLENVRNGTTLATLDAYAATGNPLYNALPYNRINIMGASFIYINNRTPFIHTSAQQEEIIIPLKF